MKASGETNFRFETISLKNKSQTVLVTGTSSGIGRGLCQALIEKGYKVFGTVRNKKDAVELKKEFGEKLKKQVMARPLVPTGMMSSQRPLAKGMTSSQWMEVGCAIGMRIWMNQLG